jgi:ribosomal protein S18 acetylase RimI-like enzyme
VTGRAAEQLQALFVEAFPETEREPFDQLAASVNSGTRRLYCASTCERILGMMVVHPLPGTEHLLLEYLATDRAARNRGLGTEILRTVTGLLAQDPMKEGLVLEVESDGHGPEEEREVKARRIGFYMRNGALLLERATGYQQPNFAGPGGIPMKLLWMPLKARASVPEGERLRELVLTIYREAYELGEGDALVEQALRSLEEIAGAS